MKCIYYLFVLVVLPLVLACQEKPLETQPTPTGLAGTWLLFESRAGNGSTWTSTGISASPQQTLTFTDPHDLLPKAIQDAALAQSRYFDIVSGGLTGPSLVFKKDKDSAVLSFFTYSVVHDTLRMTTPSVTSVSYGYSFRRL